MRALQAAVCAGVTMMAALCGAQVAGPPQGSATGKLSAADRELARTIFKQLIETNTTDSVGNVTTAADAMRKRLLDAGFAPAECGGDGAECRGKGNMVAPAAWTAGDDAEAGADDLPP